MQDARQKILDQNISLKHNVFQRFIFGGFSTCIILLMIYFGLFSRYNFFTAYFDLDRYGLVFPQCEFEGNDLIELNSISNEMGFQVRHVDCKIFYTKGMDQYYEIMSSKIEAINGKNWVDKLYDKRKN